MFALTHDFPLFICRYYEMILNLIKQHFRSRPEPVVVIGIVSVVVSSVVVVFVFPSQIVKILLSVDQSSSPQIILIVSVISALIILV